MDEQWIKWEPIQGLSKKYYVDGLCDSFNGFIVELTDTKDENKKVEIRFEDSVDAYQSTYESYRLKYIETLDQEYGREFFTKWSLFKINESNYIKWLSEQSYGFSDSDSITHFVIIGAECILDIIACYDPVVSLKAT